ncbi:peptidase [Asanoa ishikariensis]|uniref:Aminopeptidase N n=1 Tax=Asanoa ishikariensis TaxID=137265 RepID=A0A1H3U8P7_9ACTN|nr:M1 family metallopeptidase [Asanoa ishikariensis]GIF64067.1 peptidase [Asanoa ishikariensis]SDZ58794.1 Peptidase family M1 [Asanoa ishikariensis]
MGRSWVARVKLGTVLGLVLVVGGAPVGQPASAADPIFRPGAASLGDALMPGLGNGGYDVGNYDIRLRWAPDTGRLNGRTTITATATRNLSRFNLDFALPVTAVTVNGEPATFTQRDWGDYVNHRELEVTPARGLPAGTGMSVVVTYAGRPADVMIEFYGSEWRSTPTGVIVWNEPDPSSEWWFPANAHPSDKATYDVRVTAPAGLTAVTNGRLLSRVVNGDVATAHWRSDSPMATYLAMLAIGDYTVETGTALGGSVPAYYAYETSNGVINDRARRDISRTPEVLAFLQRKWGPYPFTAAGALVTGETFGSALETQTRPVYQGGRWRNSTENVWVVVHESAHQWYGDSVTARTWSDLWLAEGFATYSEWEWSQAQSTGTPAELFDYYYATAPASLWESPLNAPFYPLDQSVYQRGAMLLQALRNRVGDADFYRIMRTWAARHRHGNADSADFTAISTNLSGQNLTSFFQAWLYDARRPDPTVDNGFPTGAPAGKVSAPKAAAAIARSRAG